MKRRNQFRKQMGGLASIFFQVLTWSALMWMLLLSITLSLTLTQALSNLQEKIESDLQATASALAGSGMVRQAFADGACSQELVGYLDVLVQRTDDLDVITIADTQSVRLYHVVHERIGQTFVGDDQGRALTGESYISEAVGTMGLQRRAFCPVWDEDGQICGFVMASATMDRIHDLRGDITGSYVRLAGILTLMTLVAAGALTLLVRRLLHGFSPEGLVHFYLTQNEVLGNLDEGLIAVDGQGKVQLVNRAAEEMLGQCSELLVGQNLDELIRSAGGESLLGRNRENVPTSRPNILSSCVTQEKDGRASSATLILKDKSDAMRQAEQLNGTRHIVTALRANSHEFMNKLQVISGLLQMGRLEEARTYIGTISAIQAKSVGPVLQHIHNPNVAALLLGKLNNMRELDITLTLMANSNLPEHSDYLSTADLVTVVGNLTENAIEAINACCGDEARSIALQITEDESGLLLMVTDTGTGIAPEDLDNIYDTGFSTKATEGRGVGMGLVRDVVLRRGGSIEVDSEPGAGTTFTLIFDTKRERGPGK